jgi:hypothetical protein
LNSKSEALDAKRGHVVLERASRADAPYAHVGSIEASGLNQRPEIWMRPSIGDDMNHAWCLNHVPHIIHVEGKHDGFVHS